MRFGKAGKIRRTINHTDQVSGTFYLKLLSPRIYLWQEELETPIASGDTIIGYQSYILEREGHILKIFKAARSKKEELFQTINLKKQEDQSTHVCVQDTYVSTVRFNSPGDVTVTHSVKGPRKSYQMSSDYIFS